jgi:hypothetical protein
MNTNIFIIFNFNELENFHTNNPLLNRLNANYLTRIKNKTIGR